MSFDFFDELTEDEDKTCLHVLDIAKYLQHSFKGRKQVPLDELWELLDNHPIFPSEGFRNEVKSDLTGFFDAKIEQIMNPDTEKKETVISFSS